MEDIQIDIPTNASLVEKKEINEVVEADLENLIPKMVAIPSPTSLIPEEQKRIVENCKGYGSKRYNEIN